MDNIERADVAGADMDATSDEAPAVGAAQGFRGQGAAHCLIFEQGDADRKRLAIRRGGAA